MKIEKEELIADLVEWSLEQFPKHGDKKQFYIHKGICETIKRIYAWDGERRDDAKLQSNIE